MASGFTTTTSVTELIPEITLGVDYIFQAGSLGRSLVNYKDVSNQPGNVVEFPIYTEVTASTSVGETATPTSHQMDLSMASLTLAKRSVYVGLGDLAKKSMTDPQSIGEAMGMSMVKAIDTSIFAVVSTTNYATSAGSTDQTMTLTYVLNGINLLEVNEVELPVNVVMLPVQFKGIRLGLTPVANDDTVTGALSDVIGSQGVLSRAFGANWYASPRVGTRTVDATASCNSGLIFAQKAIGFGFSWLYTAGVESIRSDEALDKLLLNWADSAGIVNSSGVCTLYTKGD
jgi:hypothetical protein